MGLTADDLKNIGALFDERFQTVKTELKSELKTEVIDPALENMAKLASDVKEMKNTQKSQAVRQDQLDTEARKLQCQLRNEMLEWCEMKQSLVLRDMFAMKNCVVVFPPQVRGESQSVLSIEAICDLLSKKLTQKVARNYDVFKAGKVFKIQSKSLDGAEGRRQAAEVLKLDNFFTEAFNATINHDKPAHFRRTRAAVNHVLGTLKKEKFPGSDELKGNKGMVFLQKKDPSSNARDFDADVPLFPDYLVSSDYPNEHFLDFLRHELPEAIKVKRTELDDFQIRNGLLFSKCSFVALQARGGARRGEVRLVEAMDVM